MDIFSRGLLFSVQANANNSLVSVFLFLFYGTYFVKDASLFYFILLAKNSKKVKIIFYHYEYNAIKFTKKLVYRDDIRKIFWGTLAQ